MGTVSMSQFAMERAAFEGHTEVLLYDPAVDQVGVLLGGLDRTCVAVPVTGSDVAGVLADAIRAASVHTIHLLGHGVPGGIYFQGFLLDQAAWSSVTQNIAGGSAGQTVERINFWSCETGRGEIGMKFLKQAADTTGATVSGSDHKVGSTDQGGSWELNRSVSPRPPFSQQSIEQFEEVLMATTTSALKSRLEFFGGDNPFTGSEQFIGFVRAGNLVGTTSTTYGQLTSVPSTLQAGNIVDIKATTFGASALLSDGTVYYWDNNNPTPTVIASNVDSLVAGNVGFVGIKHSGSIQSWGKADQGGHNFTGGYNLPTAVSSLTSVTEVIAGGHSYAAVYNSGKSIVTWGVENSAVGEDVAVTLSSALAAALDGSVTISEVVAGGSSFVAVLDDGSVYGWGSQEFSFVPSAGLSVTDIVASKNAYAVLMSDGSVVTLGDADTGGDSAVVSSYLDGTTDVTQVVGLPTGGFAALLDDGSVVSWGEINGFGGREGLRLASGSGVDYLTAGGRNFAAVHDDGSVTAFGYDTGNSTAISGATGTGDVKVVFMNEGLAVLKADGSVELAGNGSFITTDLAAGLVAVDLYAGDYTVVAVDGSGNVSLAGRRVGVETDPSSAENVGYAFTSFDGTAAELSSAISSADGTSGAPLLDSDSYGDYSVSGTPNELLTLLGSDPSLVGASLTLSGGTTAPISLANLMKLEAAGVDTDGQTIELDSSAIGAQHDAFLTAASGGSAAAGAEPVTISQSDISVSTNAVGTLSAGDQLTITYTPTTPAGVTVDTVWLDVSGFTGDSAHTLAASTFSDPGYTYTLTIPTDGIDGDYTQVRALVRSTDSNGTTYSYSTQADDEIFFVDNAKPEWVSADLVAADDSGSSSADGVTNDDSLTFRVTFSEPVDGVGAQDFAVTFPGGSTVSNVGVTGVVAVAASGGSEYDVTVAGSGLADMNGSVQLQLVSTPSVTDGAGNPVITAGVTYTAVTVDNAGATISTISAAGNPVKTSGAYKAGDDITFTVTLSESVQAGGALRLTLNTGETVTVSAGSQGSTLTGTYTVKASGSVTDVADLEVSSIVLGSATDTNVPTDVAGNAMGSVGTITAGTYKFNSIEVDTTAPATPTGVGLGVDSGGAGFDTDSITNDGDVSSPNNTETGGTAYYSLTGTSGWTTDSGALIDSASDGQVTVYTKQVDAAGNESCVASVSFTLDTTGPAASSITGPSGTDSDGTVTFRLTLSEPVQAGSVSPSDFAVSGTSTDTYASITGADIVPVAASLNQGGYSQFDVTVSGTGDRGALLRLSLDTTNAAFTDVAGNARNYVSEQYQVYNSDFFDLHDLPVNTGGSAVTYTVWTHNLNSGGDTTLAVRVKDNTSSIWITQNDDTSGLASQVTFTAQPGVRYEAAVGEYGGNGTVTYSLSVNDGTSITSLATGVTLSESTADRSLGAIEENAAIDTVGPETSSISDVSGIDTAGTVTFRVTFTEPVKGLAAEDFDLTASGGATAGSISSVAGVGSAVDGAYLQYDVTATGTSDADGGVLTLSADSTNGIQVVDIVGNAGGAFVASATDTTGAASIDTVAPTVTKIERVDTADFNTGSLSDNLTHSDTVLFKVTFSEAIDYNTISATDFVLDADPALPTTGTPPTISVVKNSDGAGALDGHTAVVYVKASGGNLAGYDGTLGLTAAGSQTNLFEDVAGNAATSTSWSGTSLTADQDYVLDNQKALIDGITRVDNATYNSGSTSDDLTNADTLAFKISFTESIDLATLSASEFDVIATSASTGQPVSLMVSQSLYTDAAGTTPVTTGFSDEVYLRVADSTGTDLANFNGTIEVRPSSASSAMFYDAAGNETSNVTDATLAAVTGTADANTTALGNHGSLNSGLDGGSKATQDAQISSLNTVFTDGSVDLYDLPMVPQSLSTGDVKYSLTSSLLEGASGHRVAILSGNPTDGWHLEAGGTSNTVTFTPEPGITYTAAFGVTPSQDWTRYKLEFDYVADTGTAYADGDLPSGLPADISAGETIPALTLAGASIDGALMMAAGTPTVQHYELDNAAPLVSSFTSTTLAGVYNTTTGSAINITASLSEPVKAGSQITVTLSGGGTATLTTADESNGFGSTMSGTYAVLSGHTTADSADLSVSAITAGTGAYAPVDAAGNTLGTQLPAAGHNLNSNVAIEIDTTAPPSVAGVTVSDTGGTGFNADDITNSSSLNSPTNKAADATVYYALSNAGAGTSGWTDDYSTLVSSLNEGDASNANTVYMKQVDNAGNESAVTSVSFKLDQTNPGLVSIGDGTPTETAGGAVFRVTLSEPVQSGSVTTGDFTSTITGPGTPTSGTVSDVQPVGTAVDGGFTKFDVTVSGAVGDVGSVLTLAVQSAGAFTDVAGNSGGLAPFVETDAIRGAQRFDVFEIPVNDTGSAATVAISGATAFGGGAIAYREKGTTDWLEETDTSFAGGQSTTVISFTAQPGVQYELGVGTTGKFIYSVYATLDGSTTQITNAYSRYEGASRSGSVENGVEGGGEHVVGGTYGTLPGDTGTVSIDSVSATVTSIEVVDDAAFDSGASATDGKTSSDTVLFKVTFSEDIDISTLDVSDFALTASPALPGTTAPTLSLAKNADGTGTPDVDTDVVYVKVSGGDLTDYDGSLGLQLANGASLFEDVAGNVSGDTADGSVSPNESYAVDNTAPVVNAGNTSVTSTTAGVLHAGDTIMLSYNAGTDTSISSVTFDVSQFSGTSPDLVQATNNAGSWSKTFTIPADGVNNQNAVATVEVSDHAGNTTSFTLAENFTVDNQAPDVSEITADAATDSGLDTDEITNADQLQFTVVFDEPVTGVGINDFVVDSSGITPAPYVESFEQVDGSIYRVTVGGAGLQDGNGTIQLKVSDSATIYDFAGNVVADKFTVGDEIFTVDNAGATITAISAVGDPVKTSGAYKAGDDITFTVTLSEDVQANGALRLTLNTGETVTVSTSAAGNSLTGTYTVKASGSVTDVADLEVSSIALGSATGTNVPTDIAGNAMAPVTVSASDYEFTSIEVDTTADVVSAPDSALSVSVKAPGDQLINDTEDDGVVFVVSGLDTDIQSATLTVTDGAGQVRTGAVNLGTGEATIDMSTLTVNSVQQLELAATVSVVDDAGNTATTNSTPVGLLLDRSADVGPALGVSFVTGDDVVSTINGTASSHGSTDIVNATEMPGLGLAISGVDLNDAAVIKARINPTDATHQASALTVTSDLAALGQINEYAAALAESDSTKITAMTGAGFNPSAALTTDLLTLSLDGVSSNIPAGGVVTLVLNTNQAGSASVTVTLSDTNSDGVYTSVQSGGLSATDLYQLKMATVDFTGFTVVPSTNFTLFAQPTFTDSGSNPHSVFESLTDGTISVVVEVIDAAQNFASSGSPVTTQLDRQAPSSPTASLNDTGLNDGGADQITSSSTIALSGESNASFEYLLATAGISSAAAADNAAPSAWSPTQPSLATDGSDDGTVTFYVRQIDAAGNVGQAAGVTFQYDTTAPTVTGINDVTGTSVDGTVTFRVTLSEEVQLSTITGADFQLTGNGAVESLASLSGATVTGVVSGSHGGYTAVDVSVPASSGDVGSTIALALASSGVAFADIAGNTGSGYAAGSHETGYASIDTVHPTVSSFERVDASASDTGASATDGHTNADTVIFKVTFSENVDVTTLQPTDFELQADTVLNSVVLSLHQDAAGANALATDTSTVYLKATGASLVDYEGPLSVDLGAGASFEDVIGNASGASADDSASPDESYLFDNSVSAVVTVAETLMKGGDTSDVTVVFSDAPASASDFTLTAPVGSGSFSNIQQDTTDTSGKTYTATFTASNTVNLAAAEISVTSFTDGAGNVLSGVDTTLDTVQIDNIADHGSNLSVTVAPLDKTASATEAGHVSVAIDGIDADYDTVTVSISDGTRTVTETATHGVVPTLDVSTLQDQTLLTATVTSTDLAGNVATATDQLFLDMSADAEGTSLNVAMIGTGQAPYDGPVGFQIEGVDLNDVVHMDLGLSSGNGTAGLSISVDPVTLGITGLGLLGKAVSAADQLNSLVAKLDSEIGTSGTNNALAAIETDLFGAPTGTLRTLSQITRGDVADAMHSVGVDSRLEDLVRHSTSAELEALADDVATNGDVQALINQTGTLISVGEIIGVVNALGADGSINISYADIDQLIDVDPADIRASADTGAIKALATVASFIGYNVPDIDATLTRLSEAMDRPVGDVELTGVDSNVGTNDVHLMIETFGGTHTVTGVSDHVGLALHYDSGTGKHADGLSARDFLSIAQNLVTLTDSNGSAAGGDPVVGLDSSAFMRLVLDWTTDDINFSSPFTDLGRGEVTATLTVTDLQANQASASTSDYVDPDFTLDESADSAVFDGNPLTITVAAADIDANFEESDDVTVTLSGIDSDAASVTVTVSGAGHADVTATATPAGSSWTTDLNLRGFTHDQQLSITAAVTDEAGNTATATASNAITLDKVADGGTTASASFVDDWSDNNPAGYVNFDEAEEGAILVEGFNEPDLQFVTATVTDGTNTLAITASPGDISGTPPVVHAPPMVALTTTVTGNISLRFTDDPAPGHATHVATFTAVPVTPYTAGGPTHYVDFSTALTNASLMTSAVQMATLFGSGQFYAQAFDGNDDSLMLSLNNGPIATSIAITDTSGNTDTVAQSDTALLDTTADLGSDLGLTVASVVNDAGSGSVQITLAGIDADVTTGGSVVVELTNATEVDENGPVTGATVVTATHSGGNLWTADAQSLADGTIAVHAMATDAAGNVAEAQGSFLLDATAPVQLTGLDVANDNGVASDDNLTNDPSLTTPTGQGDETGGGTEASSTTYYALSNAGAGTTGWVTNPSTLVSSMNEGDTGNSNTVYYKQIDGAGNESAVSSYTFAYDDTDPTVSGLTSPSGTDTDGTVAFTLTFSEPVDVSTVVAADDFTISGGLIDSVTPVSATGGAATQFTVTATGTGDAGSSLDLAIKVGAAFSDRAGNETTLMSAVSRSAAIDTVHPTITAISAVGDPVKTSGAYKAGDEIDFTVTLSEDVQANGALRLTLNTGETVTVSTSAAGDSLTGTYTVGSSITDVADLEVSSIALGSADNTNVPTDIAGNAMASVGSVTVGTYEFTSIEIDTTADADTNFSVTVEATDKVANAAEATSVELTLDGVDSDVVSVSVVVTDTTTPAANSVTYAATRTAQTEQWTVGPVDVTTGGLVDGTLTVTATVTDDAGNTRSVTDTLALDTVVHPDTGLALIEADATLAELQSGAASLTLESGATATVTLKGSEFAAASARKATADTALSNAQTTQGNAFDTTYGTHSVGSVVDTALSLSHVDVTPTTWSAGDLTNLTTEKASYVSTDTAVTTARGSAASTFDGIHGTPTAGDVVTNAVTVGTLVSLTPATWTAANIEALQALRDAAADQAVFDSTNGVTADAGGVVTSPAEGDVITADVTIGTLTVTATTWSAGDVANLATEKASYVDSDSAVTTAESSAASTFDGLYGTPSAGDVVTSAVTVGTLVSLSPTLWSSQDVADLATDRADFVTANTATEASAVQTAATDMANATVTLTLTGTGSTEAITLTSTQVTALGDGTVSIGVTAADSAGNPATDRAVSLTIDTVLPEITAISAVGDSVKTSGAYKAGDEIDFTVTLSEDVQADGALRLTLNTGETVTVSTSAAGNSLTGTYTVGSSITDVADLEVSSIALGSATGTNVPTDIAGNAMAPVTVSASDYEFTSIEVDTTAPAALTGIGLSSDTGGTGFGSDAITSDSALTSPTNAGAETGGGTETGHTVYYSLANDGAGTGGGWTTSYASLVSSLNDGNIGDPNDPHANTVYFKQIDAAGNESTIGSFSFKLDSSGPSVVDLNEPGGSPTDLDGAVTFKLTLSEPVQSGTVTADDFEVTTTENSVTSSPFAVTSVTAVAGSLNQGGYTEFEVVATGSGDVGTVMELALKAGAKFADLAGNETTLGTSILEATSIDTAHPTITAISAVGDPVKASGAYKAGDEIDFTVTLSEDVKADGALRLTLNTGETVTVSTSAAGNSLTGTYTVGSSITDAADLEVSSIALGSADSTNVPTDIAGNAMGSVAVLSGDYEFTSIEVDTTAPNRPTIDGMSDDTNLTTDGYTSDTVLELTVTGESGGTAKLYQTISGTTTEITGATVTEAGGTYTITTPTMAHGYVSDLSVTITDPAGNVSQASVVKSVEIDTVAPTVAITAIGNASDVITEIGGTSYHTITGTAEPSRDVKLSFPTDDDPNVNHVVTVAADGSGDWSYTLSNADMIVIGQGAGRSVTASQMDLAGNVGQSATTSFKMYTETKITSNGVVDESQLTAGLGHPNTVEGGTAITGSSGNLNASDDVMDLSASTNDVTYQGAYGEVWVDDGTTVKKAYIDSNGDFEEILTGSGDDLLIGLDGVSEVFNPGAGDNTVIAGDSVGDFDVLDYSQLSGSADSVAPVSSSDVTNGRSFDLTSNWKQSDLVFLNLGNGQSFATPTAQYATLALLVAALESQVEAAVGSDVLTSSANETTGVVTVTANPGASQANAIAILQASEVVVGVAGGIYGDLNPVASVNVHAAYTGSSGKIVRSDGGLDEVLGIEGVLGTAYSDILVGDDLTSYLAGGAGDDVLAGQGGADTLLGEAGDDYIYGGDGDDRIIGGAGIDQLFGGAGRDVYVVDSGSVDTIRDFGVSSILSSQAGRGGVNDQVEFSVTDADITTALGSVPGTVNLSLSLVKISEYKYTLALQTTDTTPAATLATVDLDWGTVEGLFGSLDPADYDLNAFLPAGGVLTTGAGPYDIKATLEFVREAQVDDAAGSQVLVGQGTSDDIFVSTQGDDVVIGGLGEDTYETRILGVTGGSAINNGTETLNDLGGVGEVDTIFFEGVRDLGDLDFDRVAIRREGDGRSLEVTYNQHRGVDDPDTAADETGVLHATGKVEVFNQFSLSQSDLYAIEGLEIAKETDNPLDAAVHRYVFGEVSESAASGDILSASADEDTILIGTQGKIDEFRITAPTDSAEHTEAWIYGMHTSGTLDTDEDVIIELNGSAQPTVTTSDVTVETLADGGTVQKVSITFDQGDGAGANDAILDLFFADAGNVNSTDLIDRIKFES